MRIVVDILTDIERNYAELIDKIDDLGDSTPLCAIPLPLLDQEASYLVLFSQDLLCIFDLHLMQFSRYRRILGQILSRISGNENVLVLSTYEFISYVCEKARIQIKLKNYADLGDLDTSMDTNLDILGEEVRSLAENVGWRSRPVSLAMAGAFFEKLADRMQQFDFSLLKRRSIEHEIGINSPFRYSFRTLHMISEFMRKLFHSGKEVNEDVIFSVEHILNGFKEIILQMNISTFSYIHGDGYFGSLPANGDENMVYSFILSILALLRDARSRISYSIVKELALAVRTVEGNILFSKEEERKGIRVGICSILREIGNDDNNISEVSHAQVNSESAEDGSSANLGGNVCDVGEVVAEYSSEGNDSASEISSDSIGDSGSTE